ncbi:hypothetical protein C6366_18010 [Desulfonatronum sp. SC1]|nr:hypothetical protein C6366_18010 [Desulfonatronum sp. SC1]
MCMPTKNLFKPDTIFQRPQVHHLGQQMTPTPHGLFRNLPPDVPSGQGQEAGVDIIRWEECRIFDA